MTIQTLRPNETITNPELTVVDSTAHGATSDDSDSTYLQGSSESSPTEETRLGVQKHNIPEGAKVVACRMRVRTWCNGFGWPNRTLHRYMLDGYASLLTPLSHPTPEATWRMSSSPWRTEKPEGGEWLLDDVDRVVLVLMHQGNTTVRTSELYWDIDYRVPPTVDPSIEEADGSGVVDSTSTPNVNLDYNSPEGTTKQAHEVKVYKISGGWDQFQVPGGGGELVWDSGVVTSSGDQQIIKEALPENNTEYRAYVRVQDQDSLWSEWEHTQFTLELDAADAPTINLVPEPTNARMRIVVPWSWSGPNPDVLRVQHDVGNGWEDMIFGIRHFATFNAITSYDYHCPFNKVINYRARVGHDVGGVIVWSDWSDTYAKHLVVDEWWFKEVQEGQGTQPSIFHIQFERSPLGTEFEYSSEEPQAEFGPIGSRHKVFVRDAIKGDKFNVKLDFFTLEEYQEFVALRALQKTILVQSPLDGMQWYMSIGKDVKVSRLPGGYRTVEFEVTEVRKPPVVV